MIKHEQAITTKLQKYFKAKMQPSFFWEIKHIRTTNYAFRSDKSFQKELRNLLIGERSGMLYKFSDLSALGTPCDGMYIKAPGYFFLYWEKSKKTYVIPALEMKLYTDGDLVKSISEQAAQLLSHKIIILDKTPQTVS
jgi:hypothetical protein